MSSSTAETKRNSTASRARLTKQNLETIRKHKDDFNAFLTPKVFFYYLLIPTFCFQLHYPRTTRIRKLWLLKRVTEFVLLQLVQLFLLLEYVFPTLQKAPTVFLADKINFFAIFAYVSL